MSQQTVARAVGPQPSAPLWTRDFLLVCLVSLGCYSGFQLLMPILPPYLKSLGGQDAEIGLILGIYSISVLVARFLSGWALDRWGRRTTLMAGAVLFLAAMLLYNVTSTVPSLLWLRLFHGLGFGLVTTTCSVLIADLAPPSRRGEALGYFGTFGSVAMAVGPGLALWLLSAPGFPLGGFALVFAACALVGIFQLAVTLFVPEPRHGAGPAGDPTAVASGPLFSRTALPLGIATFFGAFGTGAILGFVPIHLGAADPSNVSIFFLVYALTMTGSRPFIGMFSDRVERRLAAIPLMVICTLGLAALAVSSSLPMAVASATICGIGFGSLQPTLLAMVVDMTAPRERGAALATYMSSIDVGMAVGSTALGVVAQVAGFPAVFIAAAIVVALGLVYFLSINPRTISPSRSARR